MSDITTYIMATTTGYNWKYSSLGGAVRIAVESGEDIAHLGELDQKLWTVLSCPTTGLEFNRRFLEILDSDNDGKIRINEVIAASNWITSILKNSDRLLDDQPEIGIDEINSDNPEGAALAEAAKKMLESLSKDKSSFCAADVQEYIAGIDQKCAAVKEAAIRKETLNAPYAEKSEDAAAAFQAIRGKVDDFFVRCNLVQFDADCNGVLDVSVDSIAAISGENLSGCAEKIAAQPIARPSEKLELPLLQGINPSWKAAFESFRSLVLDEEFPGAASITEEQWKSVSAKIDSYTSRKAEIEAASAEVLDGSLAEERAFIAPLEKFVLLTAHLYTFLNNYVSLKDFYRKIHPAIFQSGVLFIDQRACELCVKVSDMSKHAEMANLSGMFLIYCDCVSKVKGETIKIVAVMTEGNINRIRVGTNAIYYDRDGLDWDATVTKIVENPISIRQAMWSPYRRFFNWCESQINKFASNKESKSFDNLTATATDSSAKVASGEVKAANDSKKQTFDIAKFCGIFAAIGMALGYIGSFLVSALTGFMKLSWWQMPLSILAIMLLISGPSMIIAYLKLRKRNLGPVLNANGWAINSTAIVNTKFGASLTKTAHYPKLNIYDPYALKKVPAWKKWFWGILIAVVALFAVLFFTGSLDCIFSGCKLGN